MVVGATLFLTVMLSAQIAGDSPASPVEEDYYRIVTLPVPEEIVLEVSGIAVLPDSRPILCTRRGQVFIVENAYAEDPEDVRLELFAEGLQEPMGLLVHEGSIFTVQRGELSRMRDTDGDDRMDELETICDEWRISGNYHEYSFGPRLDRSGNFWMTTNKPFGNEPFGRVPWRGFALRITPDGRMVPVACGLRSPAGIEISPAGDAFYTDNQGEWCGASKLAHLEAGDFHGHPWGIPACELPGWIYTHPGDPPNGELMPEVAKKLPSFKLPAVWFPYDKMGNSPAGFVWDPTEGGFGPFTGQVFVGDQHHSSVMRVFLEKVEGHWQGACFPFRYGFQCGIVRLAFGADDSLFVGMTNRGWGSLGNSPYGLQRLVWTGATPFEVLEMRALNDGFELVFTEAVDPAAASDPDSYRMESYTYLLHETYGSDEVDREEPRIEQALVAPDGRSVILLVDGLRRGYVHELHLPGVRSASGVALLHPEAYYTLIEIPEFDGPGDATGAEPGRRNRLSALERDAGWKLLFDGKSPKGWHGIGKDRFPEQGWVIEDGCLHHRAGGRGGDLVSDAEFADFELSFEWKVAPGANSGVKYRIVEERGARGPEFQILDDTRHRDGGRALSSAGALYDVVAPEDKHLESPGRFNTSRIVARGKSFEHWLNGRRILSCVVGSQEWEKSVARSKFRGDAEYARSPAGHILLQDHGDAVWYRNIKLRDLGKLPGKSVQIFDGEDLEGWRKLGDAHYFVEDGAIVGEVDGGSQSFLRTEETFGDFILDVDLMIEAGNSGIQIRSHETDSGRLRGYQIEIDPSPRSWSGGLYDEARRGWLQNLEANPAGRAAFDRDGWNHYRIECLGPWIRTWVNGVPVTDYLDALDLAGVIGLQVHSGTDTRVRWANFELQDLGKRNWQPVFTEEHLANFSLATRGGGLSSSFTHEELALRIRFQGLAWKMRLGERGADEPSLGEREITAPGLHLTPTTWTIDPSDELLQSALKPDGLQELYFIAYGDRIVLNVNGKLCADIRSNDGGRPRSIKLSKSPEGEARIKRVDLLGKAR